MDINRSGQCSTTTSLMLSSIASILVWTPNLRNISPVCTFTVGSDMCNCLPICLLDSPSQIKAKTSH